MPSTSIDHISNAVRRFVSDEFNNLKIIYIPCQQGQQQKAFDTIKQSYTDHPAYEKIVSTVENTLRHKSDNFFGHVMVDIIEKSLGGLIKFKKYLAICFIDETQLEIFEDHEFNAYFEIYRHTFPVLSQYFYEEKNDRIIRAINDKQRFKPNAMRIKLMQDCFATMILQSEISKQSIKSIIKQYCELTLSKSKFFRSEDRPLPLCVDGLNVVYRSLKNDRDPRIGIIEHIFFMADEIGHTYDDACLRAWLRFSQSVQFMVWADHNNNEILSAAIYNSESAYIRSTAHIFAETLNTTPTPLNIMDRHIPFRSEEDNENTHQRLSKSYFLELHKKAYTEQNAGVFMEAARLQTQRLFDGHIMSWCAPALIEAEHAYHMYEEGKAVYDDEVDNAFDAVSAQIKWKDLIKLNQIFIEERRKNDIITPARALEITAKYEEFSHYKTAFELMKIKVPLKGKTKQRS